MDRAIVQILDEALMCSVFVNPRDPGLSYQEILEIGSRFDFMAGEISDAAREVLDNYGKGDKFIPKPHAFMFLTSGVGEDPDLINYDAVDFVYKELNHQVRAVGANQAKLDRNVIVEKGVQAGFDRNELEGAITCYIYNNSLKEKDEIIRFSYGSGVVPLPGEQSRQTRRRHSIKKIHREKVLGIVRDIVARRTDGRAHRSEPFEAFADKLEQIGFKPFRIWWTQTVTELRSADPNSAPLSCVVLSAALVEGSLTFAARYARTRQIGAFQSSDFEGEPRGWKAEKLIDSASRGGTASIFSPQIKARAEHLNRVRQRVHVGRLLSDNPGGVPDLRPEEGRDAKATAEQVVRAVIDWLDRASTA
ncbi:hypothetical protein [Methylobacterium variabile]|jgi:hypothetical protein|uniref:hypothetical protein n=1 Tax=Methylobacterium variabile TaxID=298794 RepID=UPI0009F8C325|nr:hypothetical protein [Methylobacterium variabile]